MTVTGTPGQYPARYCGRDFTLAELEEIRSLAATPPTRRAIADAILRRARLADPRRAAQGHDRPRRPGPDGRRRPITLPPPRNGNGNGRHPRHGHPGQLALPLPAHPAATLADLGPVTISVVDSRQASRKWNQLIRDHHYLGYTPLAGAQIRYLAAAPAAGPIAAFAFAASAWKCAPRDDWIGWDPATRRANLT